MTEVRRLNREEVNRLIDEAPFSEVKNLRKELVRQGIDAYDFFDKYGIEHFGLVIDGKPIYIAVLIDNGNEKELWTVVNKDVKEQYSLYKHSKKGISEWVKKYKTIYATMEKVNTKNLDWTKRLGFKPIIEDDDCITLRITGGN